MHLFSFIAKYAAQPKAPSDEGAVGYADWGRENEGI